VKKPHQAAVIASTTRVLHVEEPSNRTTTSESDRARELELDPYAERLADILDVVSVKAVDWGGMISTSERGASSYWLLARRLRVLLGGSSPVIVLERGTCSRAKPGRNAL
jgi:hypothetical protein